MTPSRAGHDGDAAPRCSEADLDDLRTFQRRMYGPESRLLDPERTDWLFLHHPLRSPDGPALWISRRDGDIVGTEGGVPFTLVVEGEELRGSWAVELMVDPAWRGTEVAPSLSEAHRGSCQVAAFLSVSDSGHRMLLRRGSTDLGRLPLYLRPLHARSLLRSEGAMTARSLVLAVTALAFRSFDLVLAVRSRGTQAVAVDAFDQRSDEIWQRVSGGYPVISRRDAQWLHWRFDECPDPGAYLRFYVEHRKRLIGHLVLRRVPWNGRSAVAIVDYLAAPNDLGRLLGCATRLGRRLGAPVVLCTTLNARARHALRSNGFLRRHQEGVRFLVHTDEVDLRPLLADPERWFVTSADSDME